MSSIIQSFGGVPTPSFLIVNDVQFQTLPASQVHTLDVPMKSGSYFVNKKFGIRTFSVDCTIIAPDPNQVMYYTDDLAAWLHHKEPQQLVFRDKPDIYYMAIVDGSIDIDKFGKTGKGTISFVCFDPHGFGQERDYIFNPTTDEPIMVTNGGNMNVKPSLKMEFTADVTDFAIATNEDVLYFGNPFDTTSKTATNLKPRRFDDLGQTTNGWTQGLAVDGGVVRGTLYSNGNSFQQLDKDYGTAASWHGGAMIKSIGAGITDYTVETVFGYKSTNNNQLGRVELYLLDDNNASIGKLALVDTSPTSKAVRFEARAGSLSSGTYLANDYAWIPSGFDNFYGVVRLTKRGNLFTAYIAKVDQATGKHHTRMTKTWRDTGNLWTNKELSAVQVHLGGYSNKPVTNLLYVARVTVWEHVTKQDNETGYVFNTGDILEIDNETKEILLNGEPYFKHLYPSSSFLKLEKGINGISVSQPVITNGELKFRERWL